MLPEPLPSLVGKKHVFPDGASLSIKEIKRRDEDQYWLSIIIDYGHGIPMKQVMEYKEFNEKYGHLFL
jgi:hypothetical protein